MSNYPSDNQTQEQQQQLDLQQFMQQLKQPFDRDQYVIGKENYEWFKNSNRQDIIEQVKGPINVNGEYYVVDTNNINKEVYDEYLSKRDQQKSLAPEQLASQLQQFMKRLMHPHGNTRYVVGEENFKCLLEKNPAIEGPIKFSGEYYIIGRGIYDQSLIIEQVQLSMRQLVRPINNDDYVIGKEIYENYKHFLGKIPDQQTQQVMEQAARPININEESFVISKEAYDKYLLENQPEYARIVSNSHNSVYKSEGNDLQSQIQTLESNNQHLNNNNNELQLQIQTLNKNQEELNNELLKAQNDLQSQIQTLESNNQHLNNRNSDLQSQIQTLEKNNQSLNNRNNDLQSQIQTLENNQEELNNELLKAQDDLQSQIQTLEKENRDLQSQIQTLGNNNQLLGNSELLKVCSDLREEVSKYQSALGDATSFHLGNQDSNSTSQLLNDIRKLHYKLEKFCGVKKEVKVNEPEVRALLEKYNCSTDSKLNKNLVSGVLERNVIETIIDKTKEYFNNEENDKNEQDGKNEEKDDEKQQQSLEANIVKTTEKLLKMAYKFSTIRTGTDEVSKATPTKLRQQIYSILGHRGFSKIVINENDSKEHPLILKLQEDISDLMNRYREITNKEKLAEIEKNTNEIVRQVVNIFFFRLKVQEPVAECKWFPNNYEINTLMMEGSYDKGNEDLRVDVCAFPLIGFNLSSTDEKAKVMFPAQILTKEKE